MLTDSLRSARTPIIVLDNLGHWFSQSNPLFAGISSVISAGEVTGVCGPSGCGKTTLLTLLAGWDKPKTGSIERVGITTVGWVFQNPFGLPRRTAIDHVTFPLLVKGMSRKQANVVAIDLMRLFNLDGVYDQSYASLSGGEAQRLLLARALAVNPDLLLVDEPTAQLDRKAAAIVNQSLQSLASRGAIVVVATHDSGTKAACDSVIDLASGDD